MIILDATTKSLEVKLGGAITTNQLTYVASYVDINNSTIAVTGISEGDGLTNGGTAVTVVAAPGATTSRELKSLSVQNTDTVSQTVTVQYNNNGTKRPIIVQALTTGQTLVYDEANGWTIAATSSGGSSLPDPVTVGHGGTGDTTLTNHGVLLGQSTSAVVATSAGTSGQPLLSGGAGADPNWGTLGVNYGGTGDITLTNHGVLLGQGTSAVAATSAGTSGQLLTSNGASADPTFQTLFAEVFNDFRLTLTSGTSVTTADVTAATTVYLSPHNGRRCTVFDGSGNATTLTSAEISVAVPSTTSTMYDVFVYNSSGTLTLETLVWTNDTTRATALVKTGAIDAAGVLTKSGDVTRRYVGSIRTTTVSGQTEDSITKRYVWNYYNRVPRVLRRLETTGSWTYTTNAYRQANASTSNQLDVVVGVAEVPIQVTVQATALNSAGGASVFTGIGEDSTTVNDTGTVGGYAQLAVANNILTMVATLVKFPAIGRHYYTWLENSGAVGTTTWDGTTNVANSGMSGQING